MARVFKGRVKNWGNLDYVTLWFAKARDYALATDAPFAFVATNSIVQGVQVPELWPHLMESLEIRFAHRSFKWSNLAVHNAGVTCVVVGMGPKYGRTEIAPDRRHDLLDDLGALASASRSTVLPPKRLFDGDTVRDVEVIGPYLAPGTTVIVAKASKPLAPDLEPMVFGNKPTDGGNLILDRSERDMLLNAHPDAARFIRRLYGSQELINDAERWCLWIADKEYEAAKLIPEIARRFEAVTKMRLTGSNIAKSFAKQPYRFVQRPGTGRVHTLMIPRVSSENRIWLPVDIKDANAITHDRLFGIFDGAVWQAGVLSSRLHCLWLETVGGRLETRLSYANTLVWNTFPLPSLSDRRKADLEEHWWAIDLARKEAGFGQSLGELYAPAIMPRALRRAHEELDATMETIFGSRRYRSDADRIEHMLQLYERMAAGEQEPTTVKKRANA